MTNSLFSVYFAGELFSIKHLAGNAFLAKAIDSHPSGRYRCVVPQNLEQRETTATAIRNQDLLQVVVCDCGLFHFDGPELDSGTVVEFMVAKMLDIPSVVVRTDFRKGGDSDAAKWNLMATAYPRTEVITTNSMADYQRSLKKKKMPADEAAFDVLNSLADRIVGALDTARSKRPILSPKKRQSIYEWMRLMPGSGFEEVLSEREVASIIESKAAKGLL